MIFSGAKNDDDEYSVYYDEVQKVIFILTLSENFYLKNYKRFLSFLLISRTNAY